MAEDPIVYLAGAALVLIGSLAAVRGTQRGKEADTAIALSAEMREWADELLQAEQTCRTELEKVRAEVDRLRGLLVETRDELDSTRAEVRRLRAEVQR